MIALAVRSVRHRPAAFTATFLAVLLGTALMGSFASLAETAGGPAVSDADAETLRVMGLVVGGWGSAIVLFSVASTMAITVRQRAAEVAALRTLGGTARQVRRLVLLETLAVATVAAALGAVLAGLGGRVLLAMLRDAEMVASSVAFTGGVAAPLSTAGLVVVVSLLAATLAGRRATSGPARGALVEATTERGGMRWWRVLAAVVLIGYGVAMAVVTVTVTADSADPYEAMATSGSSSILVGLGLALLAPVLLRGLASLSRPALAARGAAGWLAGYNTTRRAHLLGGVLAPVVVLASAAVGTLMLVSIDGRTLVASPAQREEGETINLLNNVVVGMIALFAAVMVVNAFAAVVAHRRAELERLWLLGATRAQVRASVVAEAAVVAAVGAALGLLGSLATVVPFSVAREEGVVPDGGLWIVPAVVAGVVALTLLSAAAAVRRTTPTGTDPVRAGVAR